MKLSFFILLSLIFLTFCNQKTIHIPDEGKEHLVQKVGSDISFDIATWNLKEFPLQSTESVHYIAKMIRDMDIDLFGIQEVKDETYFYQLMDSLENYSGEVSLSENYLKFAIIYKKDLISVSNIKEIFLTGYDTLPRPPLFCYVEVKENNHVVFDFSLINIHLKAYDGIENETKRRVSCIKLKNFIESELLTEDEQDIIILGDWNDELTDLEESNIFNVFLEDSLQYKFLTSKIDNQYSYIGIDSLYDSMIDHILITSDALNEFGNGTINVLYLDREFIQYREYVSDHRPVLAQFFCF